MLQGRLSILAICLVGGTALNRHNKRQWRGNPQHSFSSFQRLPGTENSESLASFIARIRGGSDSYYGGDYGRRKGSYNNYSQQGYYYDQPGGDDSDDDENQRDDYGNRNDIQRPSRNQRDDYYDDYYDDRRGSANTSSGPNAASSMLKSLPSIVQKGDRRIGLSLLTSGAVITMLGVSLFFNKALMRLGNLLFIAGVPMTLGPTRTMGYFLKPEKMRATACLGLGIFLVFIGSPVFGIALEIFGLLNLFGNMFPVLLAIAKNMPVIGPILSGNNNNGGGRGGRGNGGRGRGPDRYDDDPYYDDRGYDDGYYGDGNSYSRDDYGGGY